MGSIGVGKDTYTNQECLSLAQNPNTEKRPEGGSGGEGSGGQVQGEGQTSATAPSDPPKPQPPALTILVEAPASEADAADPNMGVVAGEIPLRFMGPRRGYRQPAPPRDDGIPSIVDAIKGKGKGKE